MPDEKRALYQALVDGVLNGVGRSSPELRADAFNDADLPPSLHALADKVRSRPAEITDADFAAATTTGFSEDQLFEVVIAAALGRSARLYEAGLAALAEVEAAR
jgi:alkylhydroperoxidase family enzyme